MDRRSDQDDDDDDDFSDLYKEYTGPPVLNKTSQERPVAANKRSLSGSDEDEKERDPNAVPTDFTSRDKKAWDAKSKATERNWKKRKEEEMICKLCGDSGHYTQGCPSTLGTNGKEFFQRVAARDWHVRAIFTGKVMADIEKEIGCKLRLDEKFLFVSGKDRLILAKGVDAVHKLISSDYTGFEVSSSPVPRSKSPNTPTDFCNAQSELQKSCSSPRNLSPFQPKYSQHEKATIDHAREDHEKEFSIPRTSRSKSPDRGSADVRHGRTDSHKSNSSPRNATHAQSSYNKHDKAMEDSVKEDLQRMSKDSPQAYGSNGARRPSSHSMSQPPTGHIYSGSTFNMYTGNNQEIAESKSTERDIGRLRSVIMPPTKAGNPEFPQSLEDLELDFKREATDLSVVRDKEEDEENLRHREAMRGIRKSYFKKLSSLRSAHAKQWDEFLQLDVQRRKKQLDAQWRAEWIDPQHLTSGYDGGGCQQANFGKYGSGGASSVNHQYADSSYHLEANRRYPEPTDIYAPLRMNDSYGDYHRRRREDFGRNYKRY